MSYRMTMWVKPQKPDLSYVNGSYYNLGAQCGWGANLCTHTQRWTLSALTSHSWPQKNCITQLRWPVRRDWNQRQMILLNDRQKFTNEQAYYRSSPQCTTMQAWLETARVSIVNLKLSERPPIYWGMPQLGWEEQQLLFQLYWDWTSFPLATWRGFPWVVAGFISHVINCLSGGEPGSRCLLVFWLPQDRLQKNVSRLMCPACPQSAVFPISIRAGTSGNLPDWPFSD